MATTRKCGGNEKWMSVFVCPSSQSLCSHTQSGPDNLRIYKSTLIHLLEKPPEGWVCREVRGPWVWTPLSDLLHCFVHRPSGAGEKCNTDGERSFQLPSPSACVTVSITTAVPHLAVIVSLVFGLGPADGQGGHVPRVGARESARDPRGPVAVTLDDQHGGLA